MATSIRQKIVPVSGDLVMENLGIRPEVRRELIECLNIIINSAATVNFYEHLRDALQINYFGTIRILELAKQCKHFKVLCHVSTAYVGSNLAWNTKVYEKIQPETHAEDF